MPKVTFKSQFDDLENRVNNLQPTTMDELRQDVEGLAEEWTQLGEEQQEKFDNMPEGLQSGPTGELLQNRADRCQEIASELEDCEMPLPEENAPDGVEETEADRAARLAEELETALSDVQGLDFGIE